MVAHLMRIHKPLENTVAGFLMAMQKSFKGRSG